MSGGWGMLSPCHLVGDHQRSGPAVTVRTLCHSGSLPPTLTLATRRAGMELRKLYFVIVLPVKRSLKLTSNSHKSSLHNFTYHLSSHPLTSVLPWSGTQIKCGSNAQGKLFTCRTSLKSLRLRDLLTFRYLTLAFLSLT